MEEYRTKMEGIQSVDISWGVADIESLIKTPEIQELIKKNFIEKKAEEERRSMLLPAAYSTLSRR
jgi:stage III sporulation protein SpoIIIAA